MQSYRGLAKLAAAILALIILLNLVQILATVWDVSQARISLSLLFHLYQPLLWLRFAALMAGVGVFIGVAYWPHKNPLTLHELVVPVYMACLLVLVGDILGRFLFYATHVRLGL